MQKLTLRPRLVLSAIILSLFGWAGQAGAQSSLLDDAVSFTGQVLFLETGVPGLVIGAVRNGERAVYGFGETSRGSGITPDGDTQMRVGSVTKVFTGAVLANMVADGSLGLTDTLQQHLGDGVSVPEKGGRQIRLIDLATHTSGLPRELERVPGPDSDPFATLTREAYFEGLSSDPQLFPAGTGGLYSNFGFDMLAAAMGEAAGMPYDALLHTRILVPLDLADTGFEPTADHLMSGHGFDGEVLPDIPTASAMVGASGLYSTANDMLTWIQWHLDRNAGEWAETHLLDHAVYVTRDGLDPVYGFDESGEMDAMGLAWVVMQPEGNRPFILQKAGGLQGMFVYHAFAPTRGTGVFVAINEFDFSASAQIAQFANDLITQLAPR